jgi:O-methyltransferase domain
LITILEQNPAMRGTVFELPQVAVQARARVGVAGLASRCDVIEGNALVEVPHGADAYLLKSLVHGRDDDQTVTILRNCRSAMPAHGKLILIERRLPERIDPQNERDRENCLQDISMMLLAGGRERAEAEYRYLLQQAGLRLNRVLPTAGTSAIMEADPT